MALGFFTLYHSPKLLFRINELEKHSRKSAKEETFLGNLNAIFIFNIMVAPFLTTLIFQLLFYQHTERTSNPKNLATNSTLTF